MMSSEETTAFLEISIIGLIVLVATALIWDSIGLPESLREPLGSATIPRVVCVIVIFFCAILIVRSVKSILSERAKRTGVKGSTKQTIAAEAPAFRRRGDLAIKVFLIAVAYVALIQTKWVSSMILTPLFLGSAILMLNEFRRTTIIPAILIALVIGLGTNFLFTDFFYVDLP
jgi:hypothetical protein